jgi:glutamyl-tRNA reductase
VDDLQPILQNNLSLRQKALEQAQIMINQEVQQLSQSLQVTNINETSKKLNLQANAIKQDLLNKNLDPQTLANQLTNKLLHNQIIAIRQLALEKTASELEKLFNLGEIR